MNLKKILIALAFLALSALTVSAQKIEAEKLNPMAQPEVPAELREKAVALLKRTADDAKNLNLPDNRARFLAEIADKLWEHDEKTARAIFQNAMSDIRLLVQQYSTPEQDEDFESGESFLSSPAAKRSFQIQAVQNARQNLILRLAKYDSDAAYNFFLETRFEADSAVAGGYPGGLSEAQFEARLAAVISENDPARAFAIAQQKLAKESFEGLNELTAKLYAKDDARGSKLASEAVKKLKTANVGEYQNFNFAKTLFNQAVNAGENMAKTQNKDKIPLLSESDLRELAEIIVKTGMNKRDDYSSYSMQEMMPRLKKYAPASAARLERKLQMPGASTAVASTAVLGVPTATPPPVARRVGVTTVAGQTNDVQIKREAAVKEQNDAMESLMTAAMTPNAEIKVDEVRQNLKKIRNRQQRIMASTQIARALATRGDAKTAQEILAEIRNLVAPQPRNAAQMLEHFLLAEVYSVVEPERGFTTLEAVIYEVNPVVSAFIRIGEFIDFGEIVSDTGEVRLSGMAGEMLKYGTTAGALGLNPMLVRLAKADFDRTASLADKIERQELRMEVKMVIIRSLLPQKGDQSETVTDIHLSSEQESEVIDEEEPK